jgi:hypothetical protein
MSTPHAPGAASGLATIARGPGGSNHGRGLRTNYLPSVIATSAFSSQYVMPISRYIFRARELTT